ncbi:MAG TPA: KEOPS complex subunit Cgi121 [Thermoplasmata archaeon]|jgi:KEOPS complex subunit Cgi121|nr:KEOPS complex subunit Cgi121 [Thermoplasmata archaeon]
MDVLGARGNAADPATRLATAARFGSLQLLDARFVCGPDHLVSAAEHAERAMREGTNAAKTLAVEFVLYAAGERQIGDALTKVGIRPDTTEFAVVQFGGGDPRAVLEALGLTRDDAVLEPNRQKLKAFGISDLEIDSVPPDRAHDLVLERVALVDLRK